MRGHGPTPAPAWFGSPAPQSITEEGIIAKDGMLIRWGDWIIRGVDKQVSVCKADEFENRYELVEDVNFSEVSD